MTVKRVSGRPHAIASIRVLGEERAEVVCANERTRVAGKRDDGEGPKDGVDGAALEAELA
jgi:hypothetical protein